MWRRWPAVRMLGAAVMVGMAIGGRGAGAQESEENKIRRVVLPAVVSVEVEPFRFGTGIVVSENGLVATNFHVIEKMCSGRVETDGPQGRLKYAIVSISRLRPDADLAIVKVQGAVMPFADLGHSREMKEDSAVWTVANPEGLLNVVSKGSVKRILTSDQLIERARVNPELKELKDVIAPGVKIIHHDVPIPRGASGSPLLDSDQKVVGVNFAGLSSGQNNFAVAVEHLVELMRRPPLDLDVGLLCTLSKVVLPLQYGMKKLNARDGVPTDKPDIFLFRDESGHAFWGWQLIKDGTGRIDGWGYDTKGSGHVDWWVLDRGGDGIPGEWQYDFDLSQRFSLVGQDRSSVIDGRVVKDQRNGRPDSWLYYDADRRLRMWLSDPLEKGGFEEFRFDTGKTGVPDVLWRRGPAEP